MSEEQSNWEWWAWGVGIIMVVTFTTLFILSQQAKWDAFEQYQEQHRTRVVDVYHEVEGVTIKTSVAVQGKVTPERHKIITDAVVKAMSEATKTPDGMYDTTDIKLFNQFQDLRIPVNDVRIVKDPTKVTCTDVECNIVPDVDL